MKVAYGVLWREGGTERAGRLVVGQHALQLVSLDESRAVLGELPFDDLDALEVRLPDSAETNPPNAVLVLESRTAGRVEIDSVVERWLLVDLFEKAFLHSVAGGPPSRRLLVAVRLKPGYRDVARQLLRSGPPFQPSGAPLQSHDVFLLGDEALFLFETNGDDDPTAQSTQLWDAAMAWQEVMAAVQVAEHVYSWARPGTHVRHEHVGVGF